MELFYLIFIFLIFSSGLGIYFDYKKDMARINAKMADFEKSTLQKEISAVKQRLVVLEKIITDKHYDLNEEFARLDKEV